MSFASTAFAEYGSLVRNQCTFPSFRWNAVARLKKKKIVTSSKLLPSWQWKTINQRKIRREKNRQLLRIHFCFKSMIEWNLECLNCSELEGGCCCFSLLVLYVVYSVFDLDSANFQSYSAACSLSARGKGKFPYGMYYPGMLHRYIKTDWLRNVLLEAHSILFNHRPY